MPTKSTRLNLAGQHFGRLIVIEEAPQRGCNRYWLCKCDCGESTTVQQGSLRNGTVRSCGCYGREQRLKANTTHGLTHKAEYWVYHHMIQRCTNPKNGEYKNYGGRGITVCDRWLVSIEKFIADMGFRPTPSHSIERIRNDQGYSPENCKWATDSEQSNNRRVCLYIERHGKRLTVAQWAREYGKEPRVVRERLRRGWNFERAVTEQACGRQ